MVAHALIPVADQLIEKDQLTEASAVLLQMVERQEGLDRAWLESVDQLAMKLDAYGFRPQAQHWLSVASPVAAKLGLSFPQPLHIAAYLAASAYDTTQERHLKRYPAFESHDAYIYVIEIAGACNLRCPSCPVGNMPDEPRPKGLMELSVFESILQKISIDRPETPIIIHLFNWGEPLLHPELGDFIEAIRMRGWQSIVSTTLNIARGLDRLVDAAPDILKISLSGWSQDDYAQTHARGDIDRVKDNLKLLRKLMDARPPEQQASKPIYVMLGYHLYKHNLADAPKVREFATQLKFHYTENSAVIQPVERNIDLLAGRADQITKGIADKLILHPKDLSAINRQRRSGQFDCELRFNMTAINVDRSVALCCGTFSKSLQIHDDFLDAKVQDLESAKYANSFCTECMQCGFAYTVNDVM